jgi:hypothetical protein
VRRRAQLPTIGNVTHFAKLAGVASATLAGTFNAQAITTTDIHLISGVVINSTVVRVNARLDRALCDSGHKIGRLRALQPPALARKVHVCHIAT